jgi:hypothetical protein
VQLLDTARDKTAGLILGDFVQPRVAGHAARKGSKGAGQIEALYNFGELAAAVGLTDPIAMRHLAAHEKGAVAREEYPAPGGGGFGQFFIA